MSWQQFDPQRPFPITTATGPVQLSEATLLHAALSILQPAVSVELGFFHGHSAAVLLDAVPEGTLYSLDKKRSAAAAKLETLHPGRFRFITCDHAALPVEQLPPSVDYLFIDGGHCYETNVAALHVLLPLLTPTATVAVHDTGLHYGREHQPGERATVRHLESLGWAAVHFHNSDQGRLGLTLLQRQRLLDATVTSHDTSRPETSDSASPRPE